MIDQYYQRELSHLRDLAAEFSRAHPSIAPMLSGASADPDVERMLEGTAFLSALINQRIDNDFPEIIHGLMQLVFPHYVRPIPSATVVAFTPKQALMESYTVARGTQLASTPVEEQECTFSTCFDVELSPLAISNVRVEEHGVSSASVTLTFKLSGPLLANWQTDTIRLHFAGGYTEASDRMHFLQSHLSRLVVRAKGAPDYVQQPEAFQLAGFEESEPLLPYPYRSFPGYRILQEYFILPQKFLFADITGLSAWTQRGDAANAEFEVTFELQGYQGALPRMRAQDFVLFATPAINLFEADADPILLDHKRPDYLVRPGSGKPEHFQVYSVDTVTGYEQGTVREREYMPYEYFNPQSESVPVYSVRHSRSAVTNEPLVFLSVAYPASATPTPETLSVRITCTNADLPEKLAATSINRPTDTSPELATFANLMPPTPPVSPPLGNNLLWRLLSHLYLNYLSVADADNLRALLKLYIFSETRDRAAVAANAKRVEAITSLTTQRSDRFIGGYLMRGQDIDLKLDASGFAGSGDMYIFGAILDRFFGDYASVNAYTRLRVRDTLGREEFAWPARAGDRQLL